MLNSKLYPYQPVRFFDTKEEAVAWALEVEGYRAFWEWMAWANVNGYFSRN